MPVISPLPFTLANGNPGDASQVMANFNQIVADVNQNAQAASTAFTNFIERALVENLGLGTDALSSLSSGQANTAVGISAGSEITTGVGNICVGSFSARDLQTGINNICIGRLTGNTLVSGNNNIVIGTGQGFLSATSTSVISIGSNIATLPDHSWAVGAQGSIQYIASGSNAAMGAATLIGGTVTVSNNKVTANSRIFLTAQSTGGTPGALRVSSRVNGVSFTITSTSGADTSKVAWEIKENI